jgi:hypothetical protein
MLKSAGTVPLSRQQHPSSTWSFRPRRDTGAGVDSGVAAEFNAGMSAPSAPRTSIESAPFDKLLQTHYAGFVPAFRTADVANAGGFSARRWRRAELVRNQESRPAASAASTRSSSKQS